MSDLETLKKLRDAIVFEAAWLYESSDLSDEAKEHMADTIKVVWNRAFQRAGFVEYFKEVIIGNNSIENFAQQFWGNPREIISDDEIK